MSGLDVKKDKILEFACILTDDLLANSVEGPSIIIRTEKAILDNMNEWCKK
jgi:oligoribonuclease